MGDVALPRKLRALSLCSGIGGAELALSDWIRTVAYCEIDEWCRALLLSRMASGDLPRAPIWDDLTTIDGASLRGVIECIVAAPPCQDFSLAGSRRGLDGERGELVFEVLRLVGEIQPSIVFLENVAGIRKAAPVIIGELAALGYDARWAHVSAEQSGAPHRRERWWCVAANTDSERCEAGRQACVAGHEGTRGRDADRRAVPQASYWQRNAAPVSTIRRVDAVVPSGLDDAERRHRGRRLKALGNAWCVDAAKLAFGELLGLGGER